MVFQKKTFFKCNKWKEGGRRVNKTEQYDKDSVLLSVITVVRNGKKTIEQTIKSVLNQSYPNIEYIVIDGFSSDETVELIKKYEEKIDYWISEPDNGVYDAMNKGISMATGDYICLLNADDWFAPDACQIIADEIDACRKTGLSYDVFYAIARVVNEYGETVDIHGVTINMINRGSIAHQTCFVSKEIYKKYRYDTRYKSAADYDFICRVKASGAMFYFIEKIIVNYRLGGVSDSVLGLKETYRIKFKNGYIGFVKYLIHELSLSFDCIRKK